MIKELRQLKHTKSSAKTNYLLIPVSVFDITEEGAKAFNKIYFWLKKQNLYKLERTASGGIKSGPHRRRPAWDIKVNRICVELTVLMEGCAWRIQFRTKLQNKMSGRKAFTSFRRMLLKSGIDLETYAIENGSEIKDQIEKPLIGAKREIFYDYTFEKVNHIDFHSSYAGGLANTHSEFREVLNDLYQKREQKEEFKNILNFSIGFMQSLSGCKARWAHLSRDAIKDNNERVKKLAETLEKKGRIVLTFNTDGIWYKGAVYHGAGEGEGLGEWHNDHVNCKFRAKSAGSYEFIENGVYHAVVRGIANDIKSDWKWGDIYEKKAEPQLFSFTEEGGIIVNG